MATNNNNNNNTKEEKDETDILDRISITTTARERWLSLCYLTVRIVQVITKQKTQPGIEKARYCPEDGSVLIWVEWPGTDDQVGCLEMRLAPEEWAWSDGRN